jgi:putative GTP pyrophosphokinase
MNEEALLEQWRAAKLSHKAWGDHVRSRVRAVVASRIDVSIGYFLKLSPRPRLKGERSLVDKAFHRPEKKYRDPFNEITDKVGVRFVALLLRDVDLISAVIESITDWTAFKDRDPDADTLGAPETFPYKSVHYVVRCARDLEKDGVVVPAGTTCEVQVRTLLQHAHCELTHSTIYKPGSSLRHSPPSVLRTIAKAMALIEATDEYFAKAMLQLDEASKPQHQLLLAIAERYKAFVGRRPAFDRVNEVILEALKPLVPADCDAFLDRYMMNEPQAAVAIKDRARWAHLHRQAVILLVYAVARSFPRRVREVWPLGDDSLEPVLTDLGIGL